MVVFDPVKDAKNLRKHKISLMRFDDMTARVTYPDVKHSAVEMRFNVFGMIDGLVYAAVLTYREGNARIISLRRASRKERKLYEVTSYEVK